MPEPSSVRVKICSLTRVEDARDAILAGASYVGAILSPGFGRSVDASTAVRFTEGGSATLVAVLVNAGVAESARVARAAGAGVIQLQGNEQPEELTALRDEGDWRLWKSAAVRNASDLEEALDRWVETADGLHLEGFRAGSHGGTGASFPWETLEALRPSIPPRLTLIVAGGLTPENVGEAVARLAPDVVDVSSGVEERLGVKDPHKVRAFIEEARMAAMGQRTRALGRVSKP